VADLDALTRVYPNLVGARVRSDWQYRTSFVLYTLASAMFTLVEFVAVVVYFHNVDQLAGWSLRETAVLYGMAGTSFALGDAFTSQVERVSTHVQAGTFDRFLLRPVSPYLLLVADEFAFRRLGKLAQALVVLVVAVVVVPVDWTVVDAAMVVASIASGTVIFAAIWCITSSLAFWTVETQEVASSFTYGGNYATQYPADIFTGWIRRLLLTAVPLAFVAYLPLAWILDKDQALGIDPAWGFASPLVAAVLVVAARLTWRSGIRHYRSTGS
jgi:ABC-2 type transport system permease protein